MDVVLNRPSSSFAPIAPGTHPRLKDMIAHSTLALAVGGEGSRLKHITREQNVNKSTLQLPNGETMVERVIRMYARRGVKKVVALVYHEAPSVVQLLGDGSRFGVTVTYSYDPGKPVGRGGALRHALEAGVISEDDYLIVHNPDDQFVGNVDVLLPSLFSSHLANEEKGGIASVVAVPGTPYGYSGMQIEDGRVRDIAMYPMVSIPTHIGVTFFSPAVYPQLRTLFPLGEKNDFESVLLPTLAREGTLYASVIPYDAWIPVNDEKGLLRLTEYLSQEKV